MVPDLMYVPLQCLAQAARQPPPRLGRFTLFNSAWADLGVRTVQPQLMHGFCRLTSAFCSNTSELLHQFLQSLVVLNVEFPAFFIGWQSSWQTYVATPQRFPQADELQQMMPLLQIPYPSATHPGVVSYDGAASHERPSLLALVANAYTPLRKLLRAECERAGRPTCLVVGGAERYGNRMLWRNGTESLAAYGDARFCVQPVGDSATRKGFWDALSVGCINVLFHELGWNGTDSFSDHREWTVTLPLAEVTRRGGVIDLLRAIPESQIARLQAAALNARRKAQYLVSPSNGQEDAVDSIVAQVTRLLSARASRSSLKGEDSKGEQAAQRHDPSQARDVRRWARVQERKACSAVRGFCEYASGLNRASHVHAGGGASTTRTSPR